MFKDKGVRQRQFKKGIDGEDARRKREDGIVQLRKQTRDEQLKQKRRMMAPQSQAQAPQSQASLTTDMADKLSKIPELVAKIQSNNAADQLESTTLFRKLLSIERNPPIQQVIAAGVVPRLCHFLGDPNTQSALQFEAAWALTNIASGTSEHTRVVIQHGAVPIFVQLLSSSNDDVREQAVWALGNIAGDSPECRDGVLQSGALQPLLQLCTPQSKLTMLRNATWTLSNFCRGKPQPHFALVSPALPTLANLLFVKDEEVLTDACWALSYLSDDTGPENEKIQAVIQAGACKRLVELLLYKSNSVKTPALRTVGNIVTGDDLQTQVVINCGALHCLLLLLNNEKKGIRKEACWTISNITAGNVEQIETIVTANLFPPLIQLLREAPFDIKKEAAWAISNATSGGSDQQIRYLVSHGAIPPLCDLFTCNDPKIAMVAMEGIENILRVGEQDSTKNGDGENKFAANVEECNGLDKLEEAQESSNSEIYTKAVAIIQQFWSTEDDDIDDAPQSTESGFAFGSQQPEGGFSF